MGKRGAQGNPGSPNSSSPKITTSEDPRADNVSPMIALCGVLESGPLAAPIPAALFKGEGIGGSGWATEW
jgi:hypothetical protein